MGDCFAARRHVCNFADFVNYVHFTVTSGHMLKSNRKETHVMFQPLFNHYNKNTKSYMCQTCVFKLHVKSSKAQCQAYRMTLISV